MDSDDQNVDVARPRGVSTFNTYTNVLLQLGFNFLDFRTPPLVFVLFLRPPFFPLDKFLTYSISILHACKALPTTTTTIYTTSPFPNWELRTYIDENDTR